MAGIDQVEVWRGSHQNHKGDLVGPFPGVRLDNMVAYEFELPERFTPWPGRTRLERTYVLLDLGVSMSDPPWRRARTPDGQVIDNPEVDRHSWYVDLVTVAWEGDRYEVRDLYIDVVVPTDGRHYRVLDLDEFADAIAGGSLAVDAAVNGLRRWQAFLDTHLNGLHQAGRWIDFPPSSLRPLMELPPPLGITRRVERNRLRFPLPASETV